MAITRIKNSTISNRTPKYNDVLAGLPFRPIIGTATDGGNGTSVSVAFTGNNVANGTITYTALSSPGSLTGTGTASPVTVSGLTSGTSYTFQVKAGNSLGDSAYSAASNAVTPVTPTAFESIATATGSGNFSFTSIPSTYQHLQLRIHFTTTNTGSSLGIRFNNDSSSIYAYHRLSGDGSSASAGGQASDSYIGLFYDKGFVGTYANVAIIDIHDYASSTKNKTLRSFAGNDNNSTGGEVYLESGLWASTSAINRIDSVFLTGNSNVSIALYGVKGA